MAQQMSPMDYANLPAGPPPPGVMPNFAHPQSRAYQAHIGMGVCIGVTSIFVVLRMYVKLAVTHKWGWDDCESFARAAGSSVNGSRGLPDGICKATVHLHNKFALTLRP